MTLMQQLYISVGIPKLTYGLDVWYTPPHKAIGRKNNGGSVKASTELAKVQQLACNTITGALQTTAQGMMEAHTNIPPMEATLWYICRRVMIRMCTLPPTHPNSVTIHAKLPKKQKPHEPQIHHL